MFVLGFSSPSVATEVRDLRELNYEFMLQMLEDEARAQGIDFSEETILETSQGPMTLRASMQDILHFADTYDIRLDLVFGVDMAAGQGEFPINGLGGIAGFGELGGGKGSLPTDCDGAIHETVVATNTLNAASPVLALSKDGVVSSDAASYDGISGLALGTDITFTTADITTYETTVFAGPNFDGRCLSVELCVFGTCLVWGFLSIYLVQGVITDDLGTGAAWVARLAV